MQKIDIGISDAHRASLAEGLARLLADTYTLYLKTHNFHWNVTGFQFPTLHKMFEEQYEELAEAVDELAERIRALGHFAPGSYRQFAQLSSVPDAEGVPFAHEMIQQLLEGQETVVRTARAVLPLAEESNDQATIDLITDRLRRHEKNAWMLRSLLEEPGAAVQPAPPLQHRESSHQRPRRLGFR